MCGQDEVWRSARLALILDHINGVWNDNRLENLRILCPNGNATLDTHCGRKNRILEERPCRRPGQVRLSARKVQRPPIEQLRQEIAELGYRGTGRRYGVSDNAVRKWLREPERMVRESPRAPSP